MQISELSPRKTSKSVRSEEVLIKTLKNRIKALEEENKQIKRSSSKITWQVVLAFSVFLLLNRNSMNR